MNLYPDIIKNLEEQLGTSRKRVVSDVWKILKRVISKSSIQNHPNLIGCIFNSECYDYEGMRVLRLGLEYRLRYVIENEEYEHSEDISCEFEINDLSIHINKEDRGRGGNHDIDSYTLEQMFSNIEDWNAFQLYKNELLRFNVSGCEI